MADQFIQIPWPARHATQYWGRNKAGIQHGIAMYKTPGTVVLMPINSRAMSTTAAQMEVPKTHIPMLIKALQELIA